MYKMPEDIQMNVLNPKSILKSEWKNIEKGVKTAKHEFHSFIFTTIRENKPESRTVILRSFNHKNPSIWFHTDNRSKKVLDIKDNEKICALFYDRSRKVQLRINGTSTVEEEKKSNKPIWDAMTPESKICYMGPYAPSETLRKHEPNLLKKSPHSINKEDDILGFSRFCRVKIIIEKLDWLQLDYKGHKRLEFNFKEKENITWIAS